MLPRINDLFDQLRRSIVFSTIDIRSSYHQVKAVEQDIAKIAFQMRYGHFKFVLMLFELINAPTVFIDLMNKIFHDYLDKFIMVFIKDILVYFRSHDKHE